MLLIFSHSTILSLEGLISINLVTNFLNRKILSFFSQSLIISLHVFLIFSHSILLSFLGYILLNVSINFLNLDTSSSYENLIISFLIFVHSSLLDIPGYVSENTFNIICNPGISLSSYSLKIYWFKSIIC